MDDVSGLADRSTEFSSFLTVSKKFCYICFYVFRIIFPNKLTWQMTKIFNIFLSVIQLGNMLKILTNKCDRETINYIPSNNFWINRLYFSISNEQKNSFLTIDCRNAATSKYTANADNDFEHFCCYGQKKMIGFILNFWLKQKRKTTKT